MAPGKGSPPTSEAILFGLVCGFSKRSTSLFDDFQFRWQPARRIRADPELDMAWVHSLIIWHVPQGKSFSPKRETHRLGFTRSEGNAFEAYELANGFFHAGARQPDIKLNDLVYSASSRIFDVRAGGCVKSVVLRGTPQICVYSQCAQLRRIHMRLGILQ